MFYWPLLIFITSHQLQKLFCTKPSNNKDDVTCVLLLLLSCLASKSREVKPGLAGLGKCDPQRASRCVKIALHTGGGGVPRQTREDV